MTPNRERIEGYLEPGDLEAIRRLARRIGLRDLDEWPTHRLFAGWLHLAVAAAVEEELRRGRARSYTRATELACGRLGLSAAGFQRRERRAREDSGHLSATATSEPATVPVMNQRPESET